MIQHRGSFLTQRLFSQLLALLCSEAHHYHFTFMERLYVILHSKYPESEIFMGHPDLKLDWSVVKRHCTNMGVFLCNECGKNFEEEAYLYMHQSTTHDMNTFTCEQCGENVVGKQTLKNHRRKHNTAVGKLYMNIHICTESDHSYLYWMWIPTNKENTWNQFRHAFCLKNFSFVLDLNYYSQREHLKPISSCFVSNEYSYLYWVWIPIHKETISS